LDLLVAGQGSQNLLHQGQRVLDILVAHVHNCIEKLYFQVQIEDRWLCPNCLVDRCAGWRVWQKNLLENHFPVNIVDGIPSDAYKKPFCNGCKHTVDFDLHVSGDHFLSGVNPDVPEAQALYNLIKETHLEPKSLAVEEEIGRGHFGVVVASHSSNCGPVCMKRLKTARELTDERIFYDSSTDPSRDLRCEMLVTLDVNRTQEQCQVKCTPKLLGFFKKNDHEWFVLERAKYGNLEDLFVSNKKESDAWMQRRQDLLSERCIFSVAHSFASNLHFFHQQMYIHRDIATRNLLMDEHGAVLLTDFGLSKKVPAGLVYRTRGLVDLPVLQAPETEDGAVCDQGTDVWSFGASMYEILDGNPVEKNSLSKPIFPPKTPPALKQLICQCLESDPKLRPSSKTLSSLLEELCANTGSSKQHILEVLSNPTYAELI